MRRYTQKTALVTLSDINITPLLDLAFVLLIIFMITTPLMEQSLRLELPTGQVADGTPEKNDLILVEVNAEGELFLESEATNLTDLQQRLAEDFKANPNLVLVIRSDKHAPFGSFYEVVDQAKALGLQNYSILNKPESAP